MPRSRINNNREEILKQLEKKSSKKKISVFIILILLISVSTFALTKIVLYPKFKKYQISKNKIKYEKKSKIKKEIGEILVFDDITVNPNKSNGRRFAVASIAVETFSKDVITELEKRKPQINSMLIKYFRSKTVIELTQPWFQDSSTTVLIKDINQLLVNGRINNLYYLKLVIQ